MNGWRIARYDPDGKLIGLSRWAERQTLLAREFDLWTRVFKWNCAMLDDNQLEKVVGK